MRSLERDKQYIWVCRSNGKTDILDEDGYKTGETIDSFSKPVRYKMGLNATIGDAHFSPYGTTQDLRREMTTCDKGLDIQIGDWVYVDIEPHLDDDGNLIVGDDGSVTLEADYYVTSVMKSQKGHVFRYGITRRV